MTMTDYLEKHGTGFDYELQVHVKDWVVLSCAHPASMRQTKTHCCNQHRYAGLHIDDARVRHHEERKSL